MKNNERQGEELFGSIYEAGTVLFRQGDPGDTMYIIQSGAVEISASREDGETVLAILEKGDFFGEMALFQKEEKRSATAKVLRQSRILPLTRTSFLERVRHDPGVAVHILKGLILRIVHSNHKLKKMVEQDEHLRLALGKSQQAVSEKRTRDSVSDVSAPELAEVWGVEENTQWFDAGETILTEGESGDTMYILLAGMVEIYQGTGKDKHVLGYLSSGDFFGEMALITDCVRTASVTAVNRVQVMLIRRMEFFEQLKSKPDLALHIIQALCMRLQRLDMVMADPNTSIDMVRQQWRPLLKKSEPVKISIVSLSTCAGCSAVLLDDDMLAELLETANIVYCTMLMDQDKIPESDLALIDGAVRSSEDQALLEEARRKSRFVVAWGTCACFGGISAYANRYELEELLEETYGHTGDTFAYYLSGKGGVQEATYQQKGLALLRKAHKIDDFVRVDYYVSGCPANHSSVLGLLGELTGQEIKDAQPIVCGQCDRKPVKTELDGLEAFPHGEIGPACLNSQGILCMGFLTKGGCGAICSNQGLPCWGCRGPSKVVLKKMTEGDSFEEVMIRGLAKRCHLNEDQVKPLIRQLRNQGHHLFNFDVNAISGLSRIR